MSVKFSDLKINMFLRLILTIVFIIVQIMMNVVVTHGQSPNLPEGVALSLDASNGDKGLVLPKVELTDLSQYSPIQGKPIDGLIVENTHLDTSQKLIRGIYIWNVDKWNKLLNYSDIPPLAKGTKVYTGAQDPNQSSISEITKAPIGSLYMHTLDNVILKKVAATDQFPSRWVKEISLEVGKYIGSTSIKIKSDTTTGNAFEAIVGLGLKITDEGIVISIDSTNMSINQKGLIAKNSEALWNATKLQSIDLDIRTPNDSHILRYDGSKWLNVPMHIYKGANGINITGDTISTLIDTTTLTITNDQIGAKNQEALWNASQLYSTDLDITNPVEGQVLRYDGNKLLNQPEQGYTSGEAIDITNNKISALIDTATLNISENNQIGAKNESPLWNARYLLGRTIQINDPKADQILKYDGFKWTNMDSLRFVGGSGIEVSPKDYLIQALLDNKTLTLDSPDIRVQVKNQDNIWNAYKLQGIDIEPIAKPLDGQVLKYNSKDKKWAFQSLQLPPGGLTPGEILVWDGYDWRPQLNQKFLVSMRANNLYLSGLPRKDSVVTDHPMDSRLLVGSKDPDNYPNTSYIQKWDGVPWSTYGNKNIPEGDYVLGFTTKNSQTGINKRIIFKTRGTERMRIDFDGKIDFKSTDIYFLNLNEQEVRDTENYMLMADKDKKLKFWSGRPWSTIGQDSLAAQDFILGFNNAIEGSEDVQLGGINFITNNIVRMQLRYLKGLQEDFAFKISSSNIYFTNLPTRNNQGDLSILMLDKNDHLVKATNKISPNSSFASNKELKSGESALGFTGSSEATDLVFKTQNIDRLRIKHAGAIKMQLKDATKTSYDLVVIDSGTGKLSKTTLEAVLSNIKDTQTNNKIISGNITGSKTRVLSIADSSNFANIDIDAVGIDGLTTIYIAYLDNKPEIATKRYGSATLNIGYDNTGDMPGILTYAYDLTNNNKNILKTNLATGSVDIAGIEVSFNLKKVGDIYKIIPTINKGNKTTGYLILRAEVSPTLTTSIKLK
ncbi:MAG: hypothetical protein ACQPRH_05365 [Solitalea-like symbiont of Tyrophagus putrescentiae]